MTPGDSRAGRLIPLHTSGIRASGLWVDFEGSLYPAIRDNSRFTLRFFGEDPPGDSWARQTRFSKLEAGPDEFWKSVNIVDAKRYVSLTTHAVWNDVEFSVMGFDPCGLACLVADVPPDIAQRLITGAHRWEKFDRNSVSGEVPVDELTDITERFRDLPMPSE